MNHHIKSKDGQSSLKLQCSQWNEEAFVVAIRKNSFCRPKTQKIILRKYSGPLVSVITAL